MSPSIRKGVSLLMKFLVNDDIESRHTRISSYLDNESAVIAIVLAAIDLEWTLRRVIDAMSTAENKLAHDTYVSGLADYAKVWTRAAKAGGHPLLKEVVGDWDELIGAYQTRHDIVHGRQGTIGRLFATKRVETMLAASAAIVGYAKQHKLDPYKRLRQRTLAGPTPRAKKSG
jgi:hypothetical protein